MPPPGDPNQLAQDKDFLGLSPQDQHAYLSEQDPDYAKLSPEDQKGYLEHLTGKPAAPNAGLAPPAGAPPKPEEAAKTMTSGEGPIARNMTSFESRLGDMGGRVLGGMKAFGKDMTSSPSIVTEESKQKFGDEAEQPFTAEDKRTLNPIARTSDRPGADIDYGATAANILPLFIDPMGRGVGESAAGSMVKGFGRMAGKVPVGQVARTGGRMLGQTDLTKPFKAASQVPKFWRESSPEGRMLAATKQAVQERRASMIPMRVPGEVAPRAMSPPPVRWSPPVPGRQPAVPIPPVRYGPRMSVPGELEAGSSSMFVPEPREGFAGENPGYMASVPRGELGKMALTRKPGAAAHMQQLGRPIIYIPDEADLPPRR
jgi:hypothetical protein